MIFVTLGSQKFQFNRLLQAIDQLIEDGEIEEPVFAQTGNSDYIPMHYSWQKFIPREQFIRWEEMADIVITHGGTGAIMDALKKGNRVIAVPRLRKYGEHVDDHQLQLVREFADKDLICGISDLSRLPEALQYVRTHTFRAYHSNTEAILNSLDEFIRGEQGTQERQE